MAGVSEEEIPAHEESRSNPELENEIMEGINSDKVNIHVGGDGGGSGGSMAAVIAALGNRNQGDNSAALIAALGNRNEGRSDTAAILAAMNGGRHDDGFGGGIGALLLLALLGGRRGGFGGGGDDCDNGGGHDHARTALTQSILESVADIRAQVPTAALEIQNAVCSDIGRLALGVQQGFSNLKDSVQASAALNLSATQGVAKDVATGVLTNVIATKDDGEKTRLLITNFNNENLQRQLTVAQAALSDEKHHRHGEGVEVRVSQTVAQAQNQLQAQFQTQRLEDERFARLTSALVAIGNQVQSQRTRADQDIVNLGTMLGSGTQASTSTQVGQR
jgi:hypothetical protein